MLSNYSCTLELLNFCVSDFLASFQFSTQNLQSMAPKKPWVVITNPGMNDIPLPPLKISWPRHLVAQDHFWENVRRAPMEAEVSTEGSSSAGGVQSFQTLFRDNNEGHGVIIPPRSVVRMRVEPCEIPFGFVRFKAKTHRHADFKTWMDHILTHADMGKFFKDISVLRPLQYAF